jgi:hypothetical protein
VRLIRLATAALLIAEAALLMHPVLMVTNFFVGAGILGKGLLYVHILDVVLQGIAYLVAPSVAVLLLVAAWGAATSAKGIGALVLQPFVIVTAVVPLLRPMLLVSPSILLVVVVITVGFLIALIGLSERRQGRRWHWRWIAVAAYGLGLGALIVVNGQSRSFPINPVTSMADTGEGTAPTTDNLPKQVVPQNPSLSKNPFNSTHNDSWASDTYNLRAPAPGGAVETFFTGGDCATITFDSRGRLVTMCATLTRVVAYVIDPQSLRVVVSREVSTRSPSLTDFSGGGYFVLDDADRIVFPARGGRLTVLSTLDLREVGSIDVSTTLQADEQVTSVLPDWQGRYWYVGAAGTVGVVRNGVADAVNLAGEGIENSFAVAEDGVYVVTDAALYRLEAGSSGAPEQVWRAEYDRGKAQKPGQTSHASGTTPTLFADWGVAFTDNADPQMHVVVADRRTGQVVCEQPVFTAGASATENSLIAVGDTLIVENNYGYSPAITSTMAGRSISPGMAAVTAVDGECSAAWSNRGIQIPSAISKATTKAGLVLTYSKPTADNGADGWYFTAVDARTGKQVWTRLAGVGSPFNNHYAGVYLSRDGDLYVGTIGGIAVLRS